MMSRVRKNRQQGIIIKGVRKEVIHNLPRTAAQGLQALQGQSRTESASSIWTFSCTVGPFSSLISEYVF